MEEYITEFIFLNEEIVEHTTVAFLAWKPAGWIQSVDYSSEMRTEKDLTDERISVVAAVADTIFKTQM